MVSDLNQLLISTPAKSECISTDSILRAEACGIHTVVHLCCGAQHIYSYHLKVLEKQLPVMVFFRCHKSHLINIKFIKTIHWHDGTVLLTTGIQVPLSGRRKPVLRNLMK